MRTRPRMVWICLAASIGVLGMGAPPDQVPIKPKPTFASSLRPPLDLKDCVNCAKLDVRVFSLPGDGCIHCGGLADIGLFAFSDPDLYVENKGTLPSLPGTVKLEYYDLVMKSPRSMTVAIPAVPAGGWEAVGLPCVTIVFLKPDGIKMTIDYKDANGVRHRTRTVRECPDH